MLIGTLYIVGNVVEVFGNLGLSYLKVGFIYGYPTPLKGVVPCNMSSILVISWWFTWVLKLFYHYESRVIVQEYSIIEYHW